MKALHTLRTGGPRSKCEASAIGQMVVTENRDRRRLGLAGSPKPLHRVLFAAGPRAMPGFVKDLKMQVGHRDDMIGTTAPFGSGGEQPHRLLFPSNKMMGLAMPILRSTRFTAGSGTTRPTGPRGIGPPSSSPAFRNSFQDSDFMLRSGGEISNSATGARRDIGPGQ